MNDRAILHCLLLCAALPALAGCGDGKKPTASQAGGAASTAPDAARAAAGGSSVTAAECERFARQLQSSVAMPQGDELRELTNWDQMLDVATEGVELPQASAAGLRRGFRQGVMQSGDVFGQVAQLVAVGGRYELLHVHENQGEQRALFRLLRADGGLNYHDLIVRRNDDGEPQVADIYIFATGENLSQTMRRMFLEMAAHENRSLWQRLTASEQAMVKHLGDIQAMSEAVRESQPQRCLDIYRRLPAELQREKTYLVVRVMAASQLQNEKELVAAIETMREHHPGDACLDLMSIDYYLGRQDFDEALAAIDRLDAAVDGDPYLDVMRANVALLDSDFPQAEKLALAAIDEQPELVDAYWVMVSVGLKEQDHPKTLDWMKRLDQKFVMDWIDLAEQPDYADFVTSDEHQAWLDYLAAKRSAAQPTE